MAKRRSTMLFEPFPEGSLAREFDRIHASAKRAPREPWHDHQELGEQVVDLCNILIEPLRQHASLDPAIANLIQKASAAKELPKLNRLRVALLGEQGAGKSTAINAVLERLLLDTSAGSIACTTYATIIDYKEGAPDNTKFSDVRIEFFSREELKLFINDLICRYADYHHATPEEDEGDDEVSEAELERTAKMAKEFFDVIFHVDEIPSNLAWLERQLSAKDIRGTDFPRHCLKHAEMLLSNVSSEPNVKDGMSLHLNVLDKDLSQIRKVAKRIWPFVKAMIISTGHPLLRHGLSFLDLPGYGDTSHLRNAVVNNYRDLADFEIVVAPHSRSISSMTLEQYLDRSLVTKGTERTMLVLTKSDVLFEENGFQEVIREIHEEPFISLTERLEGLEEASSDAYEHGAPDTIQQIASEAAIATVAYHTRLAMRHMGNKGIKILATAPREYLAWNNPRCIRKPFIDPQASGIPSLRHCLFNLVSEAKFWCYYGHFFDIMPQVRQKALHIYEKHVEDEGYAEMRRELERQIPMLEMHLKASTSDLLNEVVTSPWSRLGTYQIVKGINGLIEHKWKHPIIRHPGWLKMLRENGIPMSGKYRGRNLNKDLLSVMLPCISDWNSTMASHVGTLIQGLQKPAWDLLDNISVHIDGSSADRALKAQARQVLNDTKRHLEKARNRLQKRLLAALKITHTHYSTEDSVLCPIAKEMARRYERAYEPHFAGSGEGIYLRQRNVLREEILRPWRVYSWEGSDERLDPLLDNMQDQITGQLYELWQQKCSFFTEEVDDELHDFSRNIDDLLEPLAYKTEEHRWVREKLGPLLARFDTALGRIQSQFSAATNLRMRRTANLAQKGLRSGPTAFTA